MITNEKTIGYLNYLASSYEEITQLIASTKQRLLSLPNIEIEKDFDSMLKGEKQAEGMETIKWRTLRAIEKELRSWEIWERWLKKVPGIGPAIAVRLIISWYYKFIPICQECGGRLEKKEIKKSNGEEKQIRGFVCKECGRRAKDGVLKFNTEMRDFPTISKWWHFMGRHTVDGKMPKKKKGEQSTWSTERRTLGFLIGEQFNRQDPDNPYKKFLNERKKKREEKYGMDDPAWKKMHRHRAAMNETVKLFLAHFWTVAREIDRKPVSEPYAGAIMGHSDVIKPFFWEA